MMSLRGILLATPLLTTTCALRAAMESQESPSDRVLHYLHDPTTPQPPPKDFKEARKQLPHLIADQNWPLEYRYDKDAWSKIDLDYVIHRVPEEYLKDDAWMKEMIEKNQRGAENMKGILERVMGADGKPLWDKLSKKIQTRFEEIVKEREQRLKKEGLEELNRMKNPGSLETRMSDNQRGFENMQHIMQKPLWKKLNADTKNKVAEAMVTNVEQRHMLQKLNAMLAPASLDMEMSDNQRGVENLQRLMLKPDWNKLDAATKNQVEKALVPDVAQRHTLQQLNAMLAGEQSGPRFGWSATQGGKMLESWEKNILEMEDETAD